MSRVYERVRIIDSAYYSHHNQVLSQFFKNAIYGHILTLVIQFIELLTFKVMLNVIHTNR